jgi:ketosteroid isomerase-like protein
MKSSAAEHTVGEFIARINAHDPAGVVALCTADHVFIDSLGGRLSDPAKLAQAWSGYFALFPDYCITLESVAAADGLVLASGWAGATHPPTGKSWRIPAAWRAIVRENRIAQWQVYADNKPVYEILSARG